MDNETVKKLSSFVSAQENYKKILKNNNFREFSTSVEDVVKLLDNKKNFNGFSDISNIVKFLEGAITNLNSIKGDIQSAISSCESEITKLNNK